MVNKAKLPPTAEEKEVKAVLRHSLETAGDKLDLGRVQITTRVDASLLQTFKLVCAAQGRSMTEVHEKLIEAWCAAGVNRQHIHLDGSKCPMSRMIDGMVECVLAELKGRGL